MNTELSTASIGYPVTRFGTQYCQQGMGCIVGRRFEFYTALEMENKLNLGGTVNSHTELS